MSTKFKPVTLEDLVLTDEEEALLTRGARHLFADDIEPIPDEPQSTGKGALADFAVTSRSQAGDDEVSGEG